MVLPMFWVLEHRFFEGLTDPGECDAGTIGQPLLFDGRQREDGLAKRECQLWANLQDREMIADQLAQSRWSLIIRGMGFVNALPFFLRELSQLARVVWQIWEDG